MATPELIRAAGVVLHDADGRIAVVHRPRRDDWSLPKGKLEAGESHRLAAIRECREETGFRARLEAPLPGRSYEVAGVPKRVRYWRASVVSDGGFAPGDEVDGLRWVEPAAAPRLLTYHDDADLVAWSAALGRTEPLVVLRHAAAVKRAAWRTGGAQGASDDTQRPLTPSGLWQADEVAAVLDAYGVTRIVTSPSRRCRQTVEPYAGLCGIRVEREPALSEERYAADPAATRSAAQQAASAPERTVLCTHQPVLPGVLQALGESLRDAADRPTHLNLPLAPGELLVVHRRADGRAVAVEHHAA